MPLPLTLLAWDLYGGFAIHGKILVALVGLGATLGLGVELWPALVKRLPSGRLADLLRGLPSPASKDWGSLIERSAGTTRAVLLLLLGQVLAISSVSVTPGVARLLMLWRPDVDGVAADTVWTRVVFTLLVLVVGLRAHDEDTETRAGGAMALGWLLMVVTEFGGLVGGWPAWVSTAALLGLTGVVLWRPLPAQASLILSRAAPSLFVGSLAWLLLSRAPELLFGMDPRPDQIRAIVGLAALGVAAGVFAVLPKKAWLLGAVRAAARRLTTGATSALEPNATPEGTPDTPLTAPVGTLGVLAGLALAMLSLPLSTLGGLCGELSISVLHIGPEPMGLISVAGPSRLGDLGLVIGLLRLGMITRNGDDLGRLLRWVGAAFTLAAAAGVGATQAPPLRFAADVGLLCLGLAPWAPTLWARPVVQRSLAVLLVFGQIPAAAVAGRYLAAAFPLAADPRLVATCGAVLGVPLGIAYARVRFPTGLRPARLLLGAVLALLTLGLLIYVGVFFAVAPGAFFATLGALVLAVLGTRFGPWAARGWPAVPAAIAGWLMFYASFAAVYAFKDGPGAATCADIVQSTEARVLLDRFAEGGEYPSGDPYDLAPDPTGRWLVTTFKRFDSRGGWIEVLDLQDPSRRTRTTTKPADTDAPFWPERFAVHPGTGRFYFGMLGIGHYELWEMELRAPDDHAVPRIERVRSQKMDWEPSYPDVDVERNALVQSYLSAGVEKTSLREVEQPLVQTIGLDTLEAGSGWSMGADVEEMSEFVKVHPGTGDYYVPGYFNLVRFALVEVDGDTLQLKRRRETFHPTIGLGFDKSGMRMYVTNSLGGTLDVYDLETFERAATVRSGAFPRDLVADREGERVYVGNYSSGTVVEFDISGDVPVRVREVVVGPLLRGIGLHEPTGAVYAASACGIFEVTGGR